MWKKDDPMPQPYVPQTQPEIVPRPERTMQATSTSTPEMATIGRSISIQGQVTGNEDLLIQGKVDGSVDLQQHSVTVGPDGEVHASIVGRVVMVEGKVEGNITADEQVILRSSASVQGDITAPRVVLEDGARFRGGVDMGDAAGSRSRKDAAASAQQTRRPRDLGRPVPEPSASAISADNGRSEVESGAEARL
jgi:cytoskeletal protein CcmA (bactofilin family)